MNLIAWSGDRLIGTLDFSEALGQFSFRYDVEWSNSPTAYTLSPFLPFRSFAGDTAELHSARVRRFFGNLLPEGRALEDAADAAGVGKSNLFGLLLAIGRESSGALALLPEGSSPKHLESSRRAIPMYELSERIRGRQDSPFSVWDKRVRLSIPGLQDKLPVQRDTDGTFSLVDGALASTQILKPESVSSQVPFQVANEHYCLSLAIQVGVAAATATIIRVPEAVLVVERFDRTREKDGSVRRRHIIDACQALDLAVDAKYERNFGDGRDVAHIRNGVSLPRLFSLAKLTTGAAKARLDLLRWTLFQFLIGNSDAHGKNVSFFVGHGGLELAPAYDLVSVDMYPAINHQLAMAIGDEFTLEKVRAYDWGEFAHGCGLRRLILARQMRDLAKKVSRVAPVIAQATCYLDTERKFLVDLVGKISERALRLQAHADLLMKQSPSE